MSKIKIEPFLMKKGNRVAKGAIQFDPSDEILGGFHLVGFTICDDPEKGLFVLFPASKRVERDGSGESKNFFFLRPDRDELLTKLESKILDTYESMIAFNSPRSAEKK